MVGLIPVSEILVNNEKAYGIGMGKYFFLNTVWYHAIFFLPNPTSHYNTGSDKILCDGGFKLLEWKSYYLIYRTEVSRGGTHFTKFNSSKFMKHLAYHHVKEQVENPQYNLLCATPH